MGSLRKPLFRQLFEDEPITDFCVELQPMCFDYVWFLQVVKTGADGNPQISIEASNDGLNWDSWNACMDCVEMECDSLSFKDNWFGAKFMRICVKANGTTTGTISANVNLKTV